MKYCTTAVILLIISALAGPAPAQEQSSKEKYAAKVTAMEETFREASRAGTTVKGVLVEGNSLFNGTTAPQSRPYGKPYTEEELRAAKISAERNSKIFILTEDGTLYYPAPPRGQAVSESSNSPRIPRVRTEQQKKEGLFTWATLVPMVGREVEVYGDVYPGIAGVRGINIKSIMFEGEYLVGD